MKDVKQRNRRRRQRRCSQDHKRSVLAISAVVLLLTVMVSANSMTLKGEEQRISGAGDRTERADPGRKRPVKRDQRIR
mgnify:CR=1 FL=1